MLTSAYNNPNVRITTRYSVEYLAASSDNGAHRWKLYQNALGRNTSFNPWELVDKREFDDAGAAWQFYLARLLDDQTYVVHPIFEEIVVDGVLAREAYIEEDPTFHCRLRSWVDLEMRKELDRLRDTERENAELLADYAEFTKKWNGEREFREFRDQKWRERNE